MAKKDVFKGTKYHKLIPYYSNVLNLASRFLLLQPFYYDNSKIWRIWKFKEFRWKIVDEIDLLNLIKDVSNYNTISGKYALLEALRQVGRENKPKKPKQSWIQFKNKIVDIKTGEKFKDTPEYFFTNPIPWKLGKSEETPKFDKLFEEWVVKKGVQNKSYVKTLYEIIAFCILNYMAIHQIFCFLGGGSNGKSTFLKVVEKFIGEDNVVSSNFEILTSMRFETFKLHKKLVCFISEVDNAIFRKTAILKAMTGEDKIRLESKGKDGFDDLNGESPISLIAKTRPIVIMDEPQNMESGKSVNAISKLKPLAKLRYSATHRKIYNKIYSLSPVDAYNKGLVKKIEVTSVLKENDYNGIYIKLLEIKSDKKGLKAKIEVNKKQVSGFKKVQMIVNSGTDLFEKTKNSEYKGISIDRIKYEECIQLSNGLKLSIGEDNDLDKEELMRQQIKKTIENHFEKSEQFNKEGIKVLSLFFVDKVDNYFNDDGIIRKIFEEEFNNLKSNYSNYKNLDVKEVHRGYFAKNKKGEFLQVGSAIERNKEAFDLIMRNKEQLLSLDEPVQFIFSHSALKEGWDNPNVFNICTLRDTKSEMRKRQEIGRGVRLPVNQNGDRITHKEFLLSVIANESYIEYVSSLQREYEEDGIFEKGIIPEEGNKRRIVKLKKDFGKNPNFKELWSKISKKTEYSININLDLFIEECVVEINSIEINEPKIRIETAGIEYKEKDKKEKIDYFVRESDSERYDKTYLIKNVVEELKESSGLTRKIIYSILLKSKILKKIFINQNEFMQKVNSVISKKLKLSQIKEISYLEKNETYSIKEFENIKSYENKIIDLDNKENCIYEAVVVDSLKGEGEFAKRLSRDYRVELFFKLPRWFILETPVGTYNPDWAVVFKENKDKRKVYFVSETKFVPELDDEHLRGTENKKIFCAKRHFEKIGAKYFVAKSYEELVNEARKLFK